jgi:hypothetical protein
VQNFDADKIDNFLLVSEKIDRQLIDAAKMNNVFQDLGSIIDDLWIAKRSKLKLQTIIADLKLSLERFQEEDNDFEVMRFTSTRKKYISKIPIVC